MATLKEFTTAEVSRHNTPDDLWIIIDGDVYFCSLSSSDVICQKAEMKD